MKNLFKRIGMLFVVALVLVSLGNVVMAEDFVVQGIKVNGITMANGVNMPVYVERDSKITVEVFLAGELDGNVAYDTRVKAWIGGYEYGDIEATTQIFQVLKGVQYHKVLNLDIPADLESSEEYTLNIDVYDDDQLIHEEYPLRIEEVRHLVEIYDATFNPGKAVKAGQPLFVSVRLENLGDNAEDNIKVSAKIAELGVQAEEYIDELATWNEEDNGHNDDDSASTSDLLLMIPSDAATGAYNVEVTAEYDRGHKLAKESFAITVVEGANAVVTPSVPTEAKTLVNVDSTSKAVEAGEGALYKVSVANMGAEPAVYTFAVKGTEGWGTYSVDPATLTATADGTVVANVFVSPSESTTDGVKTFSVDVLKDGAVVGTTTLSLDVQASDSASAKEILLIVFLVLLAVLVLLGIVVAIKRLAGGREDESIEGQTYY